MRETLENIEKELYKDIRIKDVMKTIMETNFDQRELLFFLQRVEKEEPRLLLWVDGFFQIGRYATSKNINRTKNKLFEYIESNDSDEHLVEYLAGKSNIKDYIRNTYSRVFED